MCMECYEFAAKVIVIKHIVCSYFNENHGANFGMCASSNKSKQDGLVCTRCTDIASSQH
jgi:hypothetical protein